MKRLTSEQYIEQLKNKFSNIKLIGSYINKKTKTQYECLECGHTWEATPDSLQRCTYGCPECAKRAGLMKYKEIYNQDYFVNRLSEINPNIEVIGNYLNSDTKVKVQCRQCGDIWETTPYHLLHGTRCKSCRIKENSDKLRHTKKMIEERLEANKIPVKLVGKYNGYNNKNEFNCNICGSTFESTVGNVLANKRNCLCLTSGISKGEREIRNWLEEHNIDFNSQYTFDGCIYKKKLRFDFYIEKENLCIEYDGEQHYHPVIFGDFSQEQAEKIYKDNVQKDAIKDKFCDDNKINLLRIPYWDFNNISQILENALLL